MSMPTCPSCIYAQGICEKTGVKIRYSTGCTYHNPKPMTNADRIRGMLDEELATLISSDWCEIVCGPETNCKYADCRGKILDWLRREVWDVGQ